MKGVYKEFVPGLGQGVLVSEILEFNGLSTKDLSSHSVMAGLVDVQDEFLNRHVEVHMSLFEH
jgi:hypothetical protein